jgi:hypothetical protein
MTPLADGAPSFLACEGVKIRQLAVNNNLFLYFELQFLIWDGVLSILQKKTLSVPI